MPGLSPKNNSDCLTIKGGQAFPAFRLRRSSEDRFWIRTPFDGPRLMKLLHCASLVAASVLLLAPVRAQESACSATLEIHADKPGAVINRNIYGEFSEHLGRCIYGGVWVGEDSSIPNTRGVRNDVVAALRSIHLPLVRWPGGCFADEYHWRDGIGPRSQRPKMINTNWGGVVEDNSFGTHEFLDFCAQVGCEPYICGNVGSGSVEEMMEWVEYMTSDADSPLANLRRANGRKDPWKVKYLAVGNEPWGCGGEMRPEFYADTFRRYNAFIKNYGDNKVFRVAAGASDGDYAWTTALMSIAGKRMNGLSLHSYTVPTGVWKNKGSATEFDARMWHETLQHTLLMDEYITRHAAIMDKFDPEKKVGLVVDEWGTWYDPQPGTNPHFLYQQNTMRDAVVAALNFNLFQKHADRVVMANLAQLANVLQSIVLTDGSRMVLTPTYYVFDLYQVHQGATSLAMDLKTPDYRVDGQAIPAVSATASRDASGRVHVSLVNTDPERAVHLRCTLTGAPLASATGRILTASTIQALNTFQDPDAVRPKEFSGFKTADHGLEVELPAKSIVALELR